MNVSEFLNTVSLYISGKGFKRLDTLVLEATNHCNRNCFFCGAAQSLEPRNKGYMDWKLFSRLVDEAESVRPKLVTLHANGEPLLHPKIVDMVAALSARDLQSQIVTNGDLLTPEISEGLLDAGLDQLIISHPGISTENWQASRGETSLEAADLRIAEAAALWAASGQEVIIRCLVFPEHLGKKVSSIGDFLEQWITKEGITQVQFWLYQPWPDHVLEHELVEINARARPCLLATSTLVVLWNGSIGPCPYDYRGELSVGETQQLSLHEGNRLLKEFRKNTMRQNKKRPALCKKCIINRTPDLNAMVLTEDYLANPRDVRGKWLKQQARTCWQQLMGANKVQ